MNYSKTVSKSEWLAARKALLAQEKQLTRQRDALNAARRRLPMVEIEKEYFFEGPESPTRLLDLFEGRHQLIVYHFMFEPGDAPAGKGGEPYEEGCSGCSFIVDNIGHLSHLRARDTSLVLVSRAPFGKIAPFKARMEWEVPWYSSFGSDFNYDFHVTSDESIGPVEYNYQDRATLERKGETYHLSGEQPGVSAFLRDDDDRIYHTYSAYARGMDILDGTYNWLDLTPFGKRSGRILRQAGRRLQRTGGFVTVTNTARPTGIPILVVRQANNSRCHTPDPPEGFNHQENTHQKTTHGSLR